MSRTTLERSQLLEYSIQNISGNEMMHLKMKNVPAAVRLVSRAG